MLHTPSSVPLPPVCGAQEGSITRRQLWDRLAPDLEFVASTPEYLEWIPHVLMSLSYLRLNHLQINFSYIFGLGVSESFLNGHVLVTLITTYVESQLCIVVDCWTFMSEDPGSNPTRGENVCRTVS